METINATITTSPASVTLNATLSPRQVERLARRAKIARRTNYFLGLLSTIHNEIAPQLNASRAAQLKLMHGEADKFIPATNNNNLAQLMLTVASQVPTLSPVTESVELPTAQTDEQRADIAAALAEGVPILQ